MTGADALADRLADLLAGSKELVPYKHGDDVVVYCGKACREVVQHVRLSNSNGTALVVFCSTAGCMRDHGGLAALPKRYRVPTWELQEQAVKALPRLLADRRAALELPARIEALADEWEQQMAAGSLAVAPWAVAELRDLIGSVADSEVTS